MKFPHASQIERFALQSLRSYWADNDTPISDLPYVWDLPVCLHSPPRLLPMLLPSWAAHFGVNGHMLIPEEFFPESPACEKRWEHVNWMGLIFWFLNALPEQQFERQNCPVLSYSTRLSNWNSDLWEYAWVNRIALFLRAWASQKAGRNEVELFGDRPKARLLITHDVDAIRKTFPIRFKQSIFHFLKAVNAAKHARLGDGVASLFKGVCFPLRSADYWNFNDILNLEESFSVKSHFFVFAGTLNDRSWAQWIIDPGYDVNDRRLKEIFRELVLNRYSIGLHPSVSSWSNMELLRLEKERLEAVLGKPVLECRQHWLRFSWNDTWRYQETAGLRRDFTLGYNDRPGFRNSAALEYHPWDFKKSCPFQLSAVPTVFMDSQFYDYNPCTPPQRKALMRKYLDELQFVGGTAATIWHQRVVSPDYGWRDGLVDLLVEAKERYLLQ